MFTRDQIEEIKSKLIMLGTKDTQFPDAHKLNGEEIIAIVQDGENKKIPLSSIINDDFINVSKDTTEILTLSTAVSKIDTNNRKLGQVITFKDSANSWAIRQFTGSSLDNWNDISLWKSISGIDELKSQVETNAEDISVLSDEIERHDASILNLNIDVSKLKDKDIETSSSLSELTTRVDTLKSQSDTNTSNISHLNTEVAALQSKVDEHTESINSKITTDRIENGAVTSEKIATSAFDSTLSVSGKIAPADVVGGKITELKKNTDEKLPSKIDLNTLFITDAKGYVVAKIDAGGVHSVDFINKDGVKLEQLIKSEMTSRIEGDELVLDAITRETERAKEEENKKLDFKIENDTFYFVDAKGYVVAKIDAGGIHSVNMDESPNIIESDTFLITDAKGFIAVKIDNNGVHTAMTEGKDAIACMIIGENYYPNNTPVRDTDGRITNADVTFATGVKGNITITYDGNYAKVIKVKYDKKDYVISIDRDNKGNINKVNVL